MITSGDRRRSGPALAATRFSIFTASASGLALLLPVITPLLPAPPPLLLPGVALVASLFKLSSLKIFPTFASAVAGGIPPMTSTSPLTPAANPAASHWIAVIPERTSILILVLMSACCRATLALARLARLLPLVGLALAGRRPSFGAALIGHLPSPVVRSVVGFSLVVATAVKRSAILGLAAPAVS